MRGEGGFVLLEMRVLGENPATKCIGYMGRRLHLEASPSLESAFSLVFCGGHPPICPRVDLPPPRVSPFVIGSAAAFLLPLLLCRPRTSLLLTTQVKDAREATFLGLLSREEALLPNGEEIEVYAIHPDDVKIAWRRRH